MSQSEDWFFFDVLTHLGWQGKVVQSRVMQLNEDRIRTVRAKKHEMPSFKIDSHADIGYNSVGR